MTVMAKTMLAVMVATACGLATITPAVAERAQPASAPGPAARLDGAALYQAKCGSCHTLANHKIGPAHKGVFERKAATLEGYNYSPALRASGLAWDAKTLDKWLQGPQKLVKGSRMYLVVPDPAQRAAIIEYLRSDAAR